MKIVINNCYGGFGISNEAQDIISSLKGGIEVNKYDIPRNDEDLIHVVEDLGKNSWGAHAELKVVNIPDDVEWIIQEYDGLEWVAEKHRVWT